MSQDNSTEKIWGKPTSDTEKAYSSKAGSAVCDCELPVDCICMAKIEADEGQRYVYPEIKQIPDIYLHDKDKSGALLSLEVISAGCTSHNDDICPTALVFSETVRDIDGGPFIRKVALNQPIQRTLRYIDEQKQMTELGLLQALNMVVTQSKLPAQGTAFNLGILLGKILYDECTSIPHNRYHLILSQCTNVNSYQPLVESINNQLEYWSGVGQELYTKGKDKVPEFFKPNLQQGSSESAHVAPPPQRLSYGTLDQILMLLNSASAMINVYPLYFWSMNVTIKSDYHKNELGEDARKEISIANNQAAIEANPNMSDLSKQNAIEKKQKTGWTKMPTSGLLQQYTIAGKIEYQAGETVHTGGTKELQKEFMKVKGQTKVLQNTLGVFDTIKGFLAPSREYPIIDLDILWPALSINVSRRLEIVRHNNQVLPRLINEGRIGFEPLMGCRITVDLIQGFATAVGGVAGDTFAREVRKAAMSAKAAMDKGENGAYVGATLHLKFEVQGDFTLNIKSNAETDYQWKLGFDDQTRLKGSFIAEAAVEAGAKFMFLNGYLKVSGDVIAEGYIGFERKTDAETNNDQVDIVLYHDGIRMRYMLDYGVGEKAEEVGEQEAEDSGSRRSTTINLANNSVKMNEWILHDKLLKKDSPYRITLS